MIAWVYGSGFPKSLDVSKAIDKAAGAEREVVGDSPFASRKPNGSAGVNSVGLCSTPGATITAPATPEAQQWAGWGTALKPALEPITVARKPLGEKTVAANVLAHGTGAINVDKCRVPGGPVPVFNTIAGRKFEQTHTQPTRKTQQVGMSDFGRWPANLIHDGSDEVVGLFPVTSASKATPRNNGDFKSVAKGRDLPHVTYGHDDNGGTAARFFYCAKASKKDRDEGCEGMEEKLREAQYGNIQDGRPHTPDEYEYHRAPRRNHHPTVKPTDLMRYLCRLVTPPEGIVLDPFMGSGSTGKAAVLEGFQFIGVERDEEYMKIAESRIAAATNECA